MTEFPFSPPPSTSMLEDAAKPTEASNFIVRPWAALTHHLNIEQGGEGGKHKEIHL